MVRKRRESEKKGVKERGRTEGVSTMQGILSERCVCIQKSCKVTSREQLGKMSVKAQPCQCIRHLMNLLIR